MDSKSKRERLGLDLPEYSNNYQVDQITATHTDTQPTHSQSIIVSCSTLPDYSIRVADCLCQLVTENNIQLSPHYIHSQFSAQTERIASRLSQFYFECLSVRAYREYRK